MSKAIILSVCGGSSGSRNSVTNSTCSSSSSSSRQQAAVSVARMETRNSEESQLNLNLKQLGSLMGNGSVIHQRRVILRTDNPLDTSKHLGLPRNFPSRWHMHVVIAGSFEYVHLCAKLVSLCLEYPRLTTYHNKSRTL